MSEWVLSEVKRVDEAGNEGVKETAGGEREDKEEEVRVGSNEGVREGVKEGVRGVREGVREGVKEGVREGVREGVKEGVKEVRGLRAELTSWLSSFCLKSCERNEK